MRIIELEVNQVRGLRHIKLMPAGKNLVICGPNGSGKSGIVDAVDFLLTGKIRRLTGKGTKELSLKKHGVHIGSKPEDTEVRAVVTVPGYSKRIEISRSVARPEILICSEEDKKHLQSVLDLAGRGQHVLSRREILRFITSEAGDRAQEIQAILNLNDIEVTRQSLKRTQGDLDRGNKEAQRTLKNSEANLAVAAQMTKFDLQKLRETINAQRVILEGAEFEGEPELDLKLGLKAPLAIVPSQINVELLNTDYRNLLREFDEDVVARRATASADYLGEVQTLLQDADRLKESDRLRLFVLGKDLLDDTGECPLCGTAWPEGALSEQLRAKIARATEVAQSISRIKEIGQPLLANCRSVGALVGRLASITTLANDNECASSMQLWMEELRKVEEALRDPFGSQDIARVDFGYLAALGRPKDVLDKLQELFASLAKAAPPVTPQQIAWDLLTRIEEHWKLYTKALGGANAASEAHIRATELYSEFETSRDRVLKGLYDKIKDRFVELYREIHYSDESNFDAAIRPDGAGLAFEVDFYGMGVHPPHALHSEGHQDSMGLCLYLALAEYLNKGAIDVIILDDVVMSVDATHRREVCRVLAKHFPDHQFLITTHERAWAGQLKTEGVVTSKNSVSFYNWTLQGGPCVDQSGGDMWLSVRTDLAKGDVPRAAANLRYGLESFFRQACGSLRAAIPYNLQERWDFGEYLSASVPRLKKYLSEAAEAAKSWGRDEEADQLSEAITVVSQTFTRTQAEQWAINPNVHFNNWANFTKQDFEPVVDAMEELCRAFLCSTCGTMIEVQGVGLDARTVSCTCGAYSLKLQKKPKATSTLVIAGPVKPAPT